MSDSPRMGYAQRYLHGTGAAINVSLGSIPDFCRVTNVTDGGDNNHEWANGRFIIFTSGGTNEIKNGQLLIGATSGAKCRVKDVQLSSGTWAGGDAAGFILFDSGDPEKTGTFATENVYYQGSSTTNDATIVVDVDYSRIINSLTIANAADGITHYAGDTNNSPGVTLGTDVSEDNKILLVEAWWGDTRRYVAVT